jgi:hypothetical protein
MKSVCVVAVYRIILIYERLNVREILHCITSYCNGHTYVSKQDRLHLKCDATRPEPRFRLLTKQTSPFKLVGASVQSTTGSRGVRISGSNAGYNMFRGSVKSTGYPLHSQVSPFTSPPVSHRVPSDFNWTLLTTTSLRMTQ